MKTTFLVLAILGLFVSCHSAEPTKKCCSDSTKTCTVDSCKAKLVDSLKTK